MGQSNQTQSYQNYKNNGFIKQQIQYYRWRADPFFNSNISKVFFHFQQITNDQEKFNNLIQSKFYANQDMTINEILNITKGKHISSKEQFMTFEKYICQLSDMAQKLTVQEILYVMQVMLYGYETIFNKIGKCKVQLQYCFVTLAEAQVRIWINQNHKSNEIQQIITIPPTNCILTSEISIIKKILQIIQRLASNSTELLHFTRQFKQFMERNILQHWNFIQARKFINHYAYSYKINLPLNLMSAIKRKFKYSLTALEKQSTFVSQQDSSSVIQTQKQVPNQQKSSKVSMLNSMLKHEHRPLCHSDYSHKKPNNKENVQFCYHSKKFTSTDVKYMSQRSKAPQSPKMNKSQVIYKKNIELTHKENTSFHLQHQNSASNIIPSNIKYRKERQLAIMGDSSDFKICNFSTTIGLSPNSNSTPKEMQKCEGIDANKNFKNITFTHNNIKTENLPKEKEKEKKKLQKKVALNKYINYYKNESNLSIIIPPTKQPNVAIIQQTYHANSQPNSNMHQRQQSDSKLQIVSHDSVKMNSSKDYSSQYRNQPQHPVRQEYINHYKNHSLDNNNATIIVQMIQKGRSENFYGKNDHKNSTTDGNFISPYSKTVNKLVGNNQFSQHQSKGSFMSIDESNKSVYNGVLLKMGRSVDYLNINSSKKMTINTTKSINSGTVPINKSINC